MFKWIMVFEKLSLIFDRSFLLKIGIYFTLFFTCFTINAQNKSTVVGRVVDTTMQPLIAATVVIIAPEDSSLVSFAITDESGQFFLPGIHSGRYHLQITYLGYGSFQKEFSCKETDQKIDLGVIILDKNSELLEEVLVKAEHVPVSFNNDTVLYNAGAFKVRPNDAVEDLLKKLPGIEVSPTGEIKAQGETVNKVLVDGKEFFGNDHKIATKNLPADIVDKVAVFDKKSDQAAFTGIDDGQEEKTIDLRLKADKKVGLFGKLEAGIGQPNRYSGKAQVNSFTPKMQLSFIGNANNVNQVSFDNEKPNFGMGNAVVVISNNDKEDQFVNGKNTTLSSGLNFNYDFSNHARLRSSYFFKDLKNIVTEVTNANYLTSGSEFVNEENLESRLKNYGHNLNATLEMDMDTSWQFRLVNRSNFGGQNNAFNANAFNALLSGEVFGSSTRMTQNKNNDFAYQGDAVLRKRMAKKGRLWALNMNYNTKKGDQTDFLNNVITDNISDVLTKQQQENESRSNSFTSGLSYTEPLSHGYFFSGYIRVNTDIERLNKSFFDLKTGLPLNISLLSGNSDRKVLGWRLGGNITQQNKDRTYSAGLSILNSKLIYNDLETLSNSNDFLYLLPSFSYNAIRKNGSFSLRYSGNVNQPTILQMSTLVDNVNPLFIYSGNKKLHPEYNHTMNIFYHQYDPFYFRNQMLFFNLSYTKNAISSSRVTDSRFVTHVTPLNVKYSFSATGKYTYSAPFVIPKTKITLATDIQYFNGIASINRIESVNQRFISGLNFILENKSKKNTDLSISYGPEFTLSKYNQNTNPNISYITQKVKANAEFFITNEFSLGSDFTFRVYSDERISTKRALKFLNFFTDLDLGKSKRWTVALSVNDIFNQGLGIIRNANTLSVTETSSSNLGRYSLLTVTYSLSDFKPRGIRFSN